MIKSKRIVWIAVVIIIVIFNFIFEAKDLQISKSLSYSDFKVKIEKTVTLLMSKYNIPGTAIALVRNGKVESVNGYGWADKEKKIEVTGDTLFQIASNSKTFTDWGVMRLVEQGRLKLNKPVNLYLTQWKLPQSKYDNNEVTISRIMSHTAGLTPISYAGYSEGNGLPTLVQSLSGEVKGVKKLEVVAKPGTKYKYTGGGYSLLQLAIEDSTGGTFSKYMKEEVLNPLKMYDSTYDLSADNEKNAAKAYGVLGQNIPTYVYTEKAAAGLYTTAQDFAKFVCENVNLANGNTEAESVIKESSLAQMLSPVKEDYGFGYIIKKLPDGSRLIYHGGANRGWRSQYAFIPEKGDGLVVLTNSENGENLHQDLVSLFSEWETGYRPSFYETNLFLRTFMKSIDSVLLLLLVLNMFNFIREIKCKNRTFILSVSNSSSSLVKKALLLSLVWVLIIVVWWTALYTGLIYNGWTLASFLPNGFFYLTELVSVLCIFLSLRCWFI